jgi:hypothetical protein
MVHYLYQLFYYILFLFLFLFVYKKTKLPISFFDGWVIFILYKKTSIFEGFDTEKIR